MNIDTLTPRDYWSIAIGRKWLVIGCVIGGLGVAASLGIILPKSYRSATLIMVENQKIPESYVSPVLGGTVSERIVTIQQQVLSRTVLNKVMEEFKLYGPEATLEDKELLVEGLKKNIKVETKGGGIGGRIDAFTISFSHGNAITARDVTAKLASQFIEENLRLREEMVEGTTGFLEGELTLLKTSLEAQEEGIAQFKKKHMGELPQQLDANLQTLVRVQKELAQVNQTLQDRSDKRMAIQKMINVYETMGLALLEVPKEPGVQRAPDDEATVSRPIPQVKPFRQVGGGTDPLVVRLRELEKRFTELKSEYKDSYPDVIQLKHEIERIQEVLKDRNPGQLETVKPGVARKEPGIDSYMNELKREREENEIGIVSLKERQAQLVSQTREYEQRVERSPEREQQLSILQRDYENTRRNYQSLLDKQLNAKISENLEKRQKGEKFRVVDPAHLPMVPESPDMTKIMLAGLVLGCGLGYGAAFGLEFMAGVIRRPEEAERLFGLPVLASIPHFDIAYENKSTKALPGSSVTSPSGASPKGNMPALRLALPEDPQSSLRRKGIGQLWKKDSALSRYRPKNGAASDSIMPELNLVAKWRPLSMVAEQFRVAATRLVLSSSNQKSTVIVVTSALKGEGKSTTASNLAYVLAQDLGKQTLLVDCDFKRPMLHAYMGVPSKPGLVEAIYGDTPLETCLHRSGDVPLWVLPSGRRDHQLIDLTKIPQIKGVLTELRARFEFIILDAPPILPLADMNLLASMADMLVLVVRAGVTHHGLVEKGLNTLKPLNRAGVILTGYDEGNDSKYLYDYLLHAGEGTNHK